MRSLNSQMRMPLSIWTGAFVLHLAGDDVYLVALLSLALVAIVIRAR